jgi:hypothetical protein
MKQQKGVVLAVWYACHHANANTLFALCHSKTIADLLPVIQPRLTAVQCKKSFLEAGISNNSRSSFCPLFISELES